ncbi:MAG TPA: MBL fold metallo-hydrolase [Flavipsychrobacter sp.]|nr:MBL fold metallo-hydrolase [Flavipsychrobacter sp.]
MKITFLGTGTSQGVPVICCPCNICQSPDPRDNRLRTSVWIETETTSIVIDAGPDFRQQMLRYGIRKLDAIVFTHSHKDHIAGLDDVRAYNYFMEQPMDVFATLETQQALKREYAYIFENAHYPGVPQINLHTITAHEPFLIKELTITPIRLLHYQMEVLGFRIGDFTYITDANEIPTEELDKIYGSNYLVLNALRREKHISHFTLAEAIDIAKAIHPGATYFTHISHQLGLHEEVEKELPPSMHLAYDGLTLQS